MQCWPSTLLPLSSPLGVSRFSMSLKRWSSQLVLSVWSFWLLNVSSLVLSHCVSLVNFSISRLCVCPSGTLTVGDVVLVNTYILQLYAPLNYLGASYRFVLLYTFAVFQTHTITLWDMYRCITQIYITAQSDVHNTAPSLIAAVMFPYALSELSTCSHSTFAHTY